MAGTASKQLGPSTRCLALYASVLLKDSLHFNKGKTVLEKAIKEDPYYLPAVFQLCEIYQQVRTRGNVSSIFEQREIRGNVRTNIE